MSEPTLIQSKTELPIGAIRADRRLRPVSEAGVEAILSSIAELGQIVTPLTVRQRRAGGDLTYELLDGAHRLEAARRRGLEVVPVRVFECTNDQAALLEIDGNLAGAELNALDTAVFLAARKSIYERLHPETRQMAGRGLAMKRWSDASDIVSFASTTAEKFGLSKRHVERLVAAGSRLGPDEVARLRAAPKAVTLKDLQVIAKIGEPAERYDVVRMLAEDEAKSAADARQRWAARQPGATPKPQLDPSAKKVAAMRAIWSRMSKAERRRFVAEEFDALVGLVTDESVKHGDKAVFYNRALPLGEVPTK